MHVFTCKFLYTPCEEIENAYLSVDDGRVVALGRREALETQSNSTLSDFSECVIAPGFLDVHIHGAGGYDVMGAEPDALRNVGKFVARHGVTNFFPSTVTAPLDITLSALERLADAIEAGSKRRNGSACPLGIHLEGPFLSHNRRGMHPPENLLPPKVETFDRLWQAARGHVSMMTIAPELNGAEELIAEASRRGVCVSIGHSNADLESARRGIKAGARHATHTFNAMRPLDHRDPGILGEVLTNCSISADVIADGIHVDPHIVDVLFRAKGPDNFVLITDAISATGMPEGRYFLGTVEVEVKNGQCLRDGKLAGSVLTLDRAVRNAMKFAGLTLHQAVKAATANPARAAGLHKKGLIEVGADADFVVLTEAGEVRATVIAGEVIQ